MTQRAEPPDDGSPDLRDLAAILFRRKWLILLVAAAVVSLSIAYSYSRSPVYSASAGILVRPALTSLTSTTRPAELDSQTETSLATSVAVAALARQGMDSSEAPRQLLKRVTANMVTGTQFLTVSFSDADPETAQRGAQAFGDAYLQYRRDQAAGVVEQQATTIESQLQAVRTKIRAISARLRAVPPRSPERTSLQTTRNLLSSQYVALQNQLVALLSVTTDPGEVIDPPSTPPAPTAPRHAFDIAIGVLLGLGMGFAVALIMERRSNGVRSPTALEQTLRVPVLASIPRTARRGLERGLVVAQGKRTIMADSYRRLRTALLGLAEASNTKVILVTSAAGGEGKTSTVANLGVALAEIGKRVVLVSADLRRPGLERMFGNDHRPGLSHALGEGVPPFDPVRQTNIPNLWFVPRGAPSHHVEPVNLLQTDRMRALLNAWVEDADFVLVDSPPVLQESDPLVLARMVDGVLFVAAAGTSRWEDVALARDELDRTGEILAGVLIGVRVSRRDRRVWKRRGAAVRRTDVDRRSRSVKRPQVLRQEH